MTVKILSSFKKWIKKSSIISYAVRRFRLFRMGRRHPNLLSDGTLLKCDDEMRAEAFEPLEQAFFGEVINDAELFVNVGANVGLYACKALRRGKRVICFEPDVFNYRLLVENIELNSDGTKSIALNCGAGSHWSILKVFHAATGSSFIEGWANSSKRFFNFAQVFRLDDLYLHDFKRVFFLVDVEGFEAQVVDGAASIISSTLPQTWMIEIMTTDEHGLIDKLPTDQIRLLDHFEKNGFQLFRLTESGPLPMGFALLRESIANRSDAFGHNFVFRKNWLMDRPLF